LYIKVPNIETTISLTLTSLCDLWWSKWTCFHCYGFLLPHPSSPSLNPRSFHPSLTFLISTEAVSPKALFSGQHLLHTRYIIF